MKKVLTQVDLQNYMAIPRNQKQKHQHQATCTVSVIFATSSMVSVIFLGLPWDPAHHGAKHPATGLAILVAHTLRHPFLGTTMHISQEIHGNAQTKQLNGTVSMAKLSKYFTGLVISQFCIKLDGEFVICLCLRTGNCGLLSLLIHLIHLPKMMCFFSTTVSIKFSQVTVIDSYQTI